MIQVKFNMEPGCEDLKPAKAHADDAAFDLRSRVDMTAEPGKVALVPTGLHLELPVGYEAQVRPRSGLALKHQIGVLNSPGTFTYADRLGIPGEVVKPLTEREDCVYFAELPFPARLEGVHDAAARTAASVACRAE